MIPTARIRKRRKSVCSGAATHFLLKMLLEDLTQLFAQITKTPKVKLQTLSTCTYSPYIIDSLLP